MVREQFHGTKKIALSVAVPELTPRVPGLLRVQEQDIAHKPARPSNEIPCPKQSRADSGSRSLAVNL